MSKRVPKPKVECSACGAPAKIVRGSYPFRECGLPNVVLQGVELIRCSQCGNEDPVIPRLNQLMRVLALAVVCKPYRLRGEDVRFLRKYLKMTSDEFARLLHIDKTNLSKWENNHDRIGPQSDRLIRMMAVALGEGLGDELQNVIASFPRIQQARSTVRIDMDAANGSYQYA
ncbi:MAG: helix-turn-helix domain-containing protein [Bryobacterales bacterium]|nr:helix-turn-helix domain-containing protein [Bryobacterales bacterium]